MLWGTLIRTTRKSRGLTLVALRDECGVDPSTVSRIENDQAIGHWDTVLTLRRILRLDDTSMLDAIARTLDSLKSRAS